MQIQRYLLKPDCKPDYFGEHFVENKWDFDWYFGFDENGKTKIGIVGQPSCEAESFVRGFLVRDDKLLITPSEKAPRIMRQSDSFAQIRGTDGCAGKKEVSELVKLILGNEVTHTFISRSNEEVYSRSVITFSTLAPSSSLYDIGKEMPILIEKEIDYTPLYRELEIAKQKALVKLGINA